jgi:CheY-like chemotaxis protein
VLKLPTIGRECEPLARQALAEGWSPIQFLRALLDAELAARTEHAIERRMRAARLPSPKTLAQFDWRRAHGLERARVEDLGRCAWIADVATELDPAAALERVGRGERFDLVLCDVMMPGMSGPELFERVVACIPELGAAFVFASGGMPAEVQERLRATGRPCLEKPISTAALLELLVPSVPSVE